LHLVVLGNGVAGVTAARYVRQRDPSARITLVSDEAEHFFARTALMYAYMGQLTRGHLEPYERGFWGKNRLHLVHDRVERVDVAAKQLHLRSGEPLGYDRLLLATGSVPMFFGWPGQDLHGVQGLYHLQDLDRMEAATRGVERAVVVGGGLIGVEMAEMLHTRGVHVTFLIREPWAMGHFLPEEEGRLVERETRRHGIDLRTSTELERLVGDEGGRVRAAVTTTGEEIPAQFVGLTTGVRPNVDFLRESGIELNRGVLVDRCFRTSAPDVFAAGDCAEFREPLPGRKPVEQLWYTARAHGAFAAHAILGHPRPYRPGVFYNSAKFFDVEYQTYGRIDLRPPEGESTLYWEHPDGRAAARLQHETDGQRRVVGVSVMGARHRHAVWAAWIEAGWGVEAVLAALPSADFDPELTREVAPALVEAYNRQHGTWVRVQARRGWREWMARLPMRGNAAKTPLRASLHL